MDWSIDDDNILKVLVPLNEEMISIANEAKSKIPDGDYTLLDFVFIGFFNRFIDTLVSTNILLQNYKQNRNVETAIGLTFRASLLDFMTLVYFGSYELDIDDSKPETNKKHEEVLTNFVCEQLRYTIKYWELVYKSRVINDKEYSLALKNFYETHKVYFTHFDEKNLSACLKGKKYTNTDMFNRIHQDKKLKHLSNVYDYYTFYSKYDHFGILTNSMQDMSITDEFSRIRYCYDYIYQGIIITVLKLGDKFPSLLPYGDELQKTYKKLRPLLK